MEFEFLRRQKTKKIQTTSKIICTVPIIQLYICIKVHTCGGGHLIDDRARAIFLQYILSLELRQPDPCFCIFIIVYLPFFI